MSGRYSIEGPWSTREEMTGVYVVETATLVDSRGGYRYEDGAYRVRLLRPVEGFKTETFRGESAWNCADNRARDIWWRVQRTSTRCDECNHWIPNDADAVNRHHARTCPLHPSSVVPS